MSAIAKILKTLLKSATKEAPAKGKSTSKILHELKETPKNTGGITPEKIKRARTNLRGDSTPPPSSPVKDSLELLLDKYKAAKDPEEKTLLKELLQKQLGAAASRNWRK